MAIPGCLSTCTVQIIIKYIDTVLELFKEAVSICGLPSCVRTDQGGKNVNVSMFLLTHPLRGCVRRNMVIVGDWSLVIVGRSVHNQRIERMWRDVFEGVLGFYHGLFHHLESVNMLDPHNTTFSVFIRSSSPGLTGICSPGKRLGLDIF